MIIPILLDPLIIVPIHNVVPLVPSSKTSMVGEMITFDCSASIILTGKKWTFNDGPLPNNVDVLGKSQNRIQIRNIQRNNEGLYRCITKDVYGLETISEGRLIVVSKVIKLLQVSLSH